MIFVFIFEANAFLSFSLSTFLPNRAAINSAGYYRYLGSLTTPPCTESVIWNVFNYTLSISSSQVFTIHNDFIFSSICLTIIFQ